MSDYPELDKIKEIAPVSQRCAEFLEYVQAEYGIELTVYSPEVDEYIPISLDVQEALEGYFDIDAVQAERERQSILDSINQGSSNVGAASS
jgi:hypothetical protein